MKHIIASAVVTAIGCFAPPAWSQTDSTPVKPPDVAGNPPRPGTDAPMNAWLDSSTPGKFHKFLEQLAGEWDAEIVLNTPDGYTQKSTGTMSSTMIFDGRFLQSTFSGDVMGSTMRGISLWGYNNVDQRYEAAWIDSLSTGVYTSRGSVNDSGTVFTMRGEHTDPVTRRTVRQREVTTLISPDKYTMEFFGTPAGTDDRVMIITFTRKPAGDKPTPPPPESHVHPH